MGPEREQTDLRVSKRKAEYRDAQSFVSLSKATLTKLGSDQLPHDKFATKTPSNCGAVIGKQKTEANKVRNYT